MSQLSKIIQHLQSGQNLSESDCTFAAQALTEPEVSLTEKKAFLVSLHQKGESVEEVTSFARVFRDLAKDPQLSDISSQAIDIVGTGGSGSRGYNISSVTAFIVAAAGCKVLKHGNRAITSQSGSADFLSAWGIRMDTEPAMLRQAIDELDFCFFFAPAFHPAFKEIMPVRKEMAAEGKRSIFNILGPLINPAKPAYQLLGVFSPEWVNPLALALHKLGLKRGLTVCCSLPDGTTMDEFTTAGDNLVSGFGSMESIQTTWKVRDLGFQPVSLDQIRGGTADENKAILEKILAGEGSSGLIDTLVLNAAAAFLILDKVESLAEGESLAREILLGGTLRLWLEKAQAFYATTQPGA